MQLAQNATPLGWRLTARLLQDISSAATVAISARRTLKFLPSHAHGHCHQVVRCRPPPNTCCVEQNFVHVVPNLCPTREECHKEDRLRKGISAVRRTTSAMFIKSRVADSQRRSHALCHNPDCHTAVCPAWPICNKT